MKTEAEYRQEAERIRVLAADCGDAHNSGENIEAVVRREARKGLLRSPRRRFVRRRNS
jgi:hypothetical protein